MQKQNFAEQVQEEFLFVNRNQKQSLRQINIQHLDSVGIRLSSLSGEVREFPVTLRWTQSCLARIESQSTAQSCLFKCAELVVTI